jgi:hypothetical protein
MNIEGFDRLELLQGGEVWIKAAAIQAIRPVHPPLKGVQACDVQLSGACYTVKATPSELARLIPENIQ